MLLRCLPITVLPLLLSPPAFVADRCLYFTSPTLSEAGAAADGVANTQTVRPTPPVP